jgi:hypothetical protein
MGMRDRLNRMEDVGFFVTMAFVSIVIGFGVIGVIGRVISFFAQ